MPKVLLDAGHYGSKYNQGVISEYYESNMTWELQGYLKKELLAYGITVGVTRTNKDTDVAVYNRGTMAKGYDLLISLHSNAASAESAKRVSIYKPLSGIGDRIAELIGKAVFNCMNLKADKYWYYETKTRKSEKGNWEYYGVLRGAADVGIPALIVEHSFHTNKEACSWLLKSANLKELAKAEAKAIAEYFGITEKPTKNETAFEEMFMGVKSVTVNLNQLSKGAKGEHVKNLQILLIGKGYSCGSSGADGDFGTNTEKAVKKFQKDNGLTADGICGKNTWTKLLT